MLEVWPFILENGHIKRKRENKIMKIYVVLEQRGIFNIHPTYRGAWNDRVSAQEWVKKHCPNGYIYVYDMDNPIINKELPGNLVAEDKI